MVEIDAGMAQVDAEKNVMGTYFQCQCVARRNGNRMFRRGFRVALLKSQVSDSVAID
jgi:hypothetical protein